MSVGNTTAAEPIEVHGREQRTEMHDAGPRGSLLAWGSLGIDLIMSKLKGQYVKDTFFQTVLDNPKDFRNFEHKEQLIYLKESDKRVLCVPKLMIQGQSAWEIIISEAHSILTHLGSAKMLDYL